MSNKNKVKQFKNKTEMKTFTILRKNSKSYEIIEAASKAAIYKAFGKCNIIECYICSGRYLFKL